MNNIDVCVLGGGPAGYHAAIKAAQLGAKVALIEEREVGGLCLNRGCIPTKAFLHAVGLLNEIKKSETYGVKVENVQTDFSAMKRRADSIVKRLVAGIKECISSNEIEIVQGHGRLISHNEVEATATSGYRKAIECKKIVLATGSKLLRHWDTEAVLPCDEFFAQDELPESLVILGANPVGLVLGHLSNSLGVKTTILDRSSNPLSQFDLEVSRRLLHVLRRHGVNVLVGTDALEVTGDNAKHILHLSNGERLEAEKIVSAERTGNTDNLNLSEIGVSVKDGFVVVDDRMETTAKGVYAAGDLTGSFSAQEAFHHGTIAAQNALGEEATVSHLVPRCIYTTPEVASIGLNEDEARKKALDFKVGRFPFAASGKAMCLDQGEGFIKLIVDSRLGEILGIHMIGPSVTEMIAGASLAIYLEATPEAVGDTIFPHPTLSEAFKEAALTVIGRSIHLPKTTS